MRQADADRRAIERDLHDGLQQQLVGAAADLALGRLDDVAVDVRQALDAAGKLAHRIYPPLLEAGGLGAALRAAAATVGVPVRLRNAANGTYPHEVAGAVYFSCLDLLEQASATSEATIAIRVEGDALVFEVEVAGAVVSDGSQDRIDALGGSLTIHPGRVSASLPLAR